MAKYIAISDVHLGQNHGDSIAGGQYCLLSQIPPEFDDAQCQAEQTMDALSERVSGFAGEDPISLVVVGDLLDLSLAFVRESLVDLIALLKRLPAVHELVYVIGNHNHHIWSLHSEWERSLSLMNKGELPKAGGMYRRTDKMGERHHMLSELCTKQLGRPIQITIAYPTFAFEHEQGPTGQKSLVYFTHGHLFGGVYTTLSELLSYKLAEKQLDCEEVSATVNAPLIELIYWNLAQAGDGLGADGFMEQIYSDLQHGDESRVRHLLEHSVELLIPDGIVWGIPDRLEQKLVVSAGMHMIRGTEASKTGSKSADRHSKIEVTRARLECWVKNCELDPALPTHLIYGHTHVADEWTIPDTNIRSYNLGSWLVEPTHNPPQTRLVFIDATAERLNVSYESL